MQRYDLYSKSQILWWYLGLSRFFRWNVVSYHYSKSITRCSKCSFSFSMSITNSLNYLCICLFLAHRAYNHNSKTSSNLQKQWILLSKLQLMFYFMQQCIGMSRTFKRNYLSWLFWKWISMWWFQTLYFKFFDLWWKRRLFWWIWWKTAMQW